MRFTFPSCEFDDAVAAIVCGTASGEQARALNELLRRDGAARDEYILRAELHSRLASEPDLFSSALQGAEETFSIQEGARDSARLSVPRTEAQNNAQALSTDKSKRREHRAPMSRRAMTAFALAACLVLLAAGWRALHVARQDDRRGTTSKAVAMLNRVVDAEWNPPDEAPRLPVRMRLRRIPPSR